MRDRNQILSVECAGPEEGYRHRNLKGRTAEACGMWNNGYESAIVIARRNTHNNGGPHLRGHPEINQPNLASSSANH
jgi:hypothetical protein